MENNEEKIKIEPKKGDQFKKLTKEKVISDDAYMSRQQSRQVSVNSRNFLNSSFYVNKRYSMVLKTYDLFFFKKR